VRPFCAESEQVASERFRHLGAVGRDDRSGDVPVARRSAESIAAPDDCVVADAVAARKPALRWKRPSDW
jgi:hypothetical protein